MINKNVQKPNVHSTVMGKNKLLGSAKTETKKIGISCYSTDLII